MQTSAQYQTMDLPRNTVVEGLQTAAFWKINNGTIALCPADALPNLANTVHDYLAPNVSLCDPKVWSWPVPGAAKTLSRNGRKNFGRSQVDVPRPGHSYATVGVPGGQSRLEQPAAVHSDGFPCRYWFCVGGWHSDDLVTACVLQTLMVMAIPFPPAVPAGHVQSPV
jgi:hypothetical protein